MKIHGLQKMTLLDYPGRVACTVFLGGCDFRCPFCHNAELLDAGAPAVMEDAELLAFLEKRRGLLDGVAITGGEPLLRSGLYELLSAIRALGYPVKLDTNGNHPAKLKELVAAGLVDYVAMDIKNRPEKYAETVGLPDLDLAPIRRTVDLLLSGAVDYEFRTTVTGRLHTPEDNGAAAEWIAGAKRYFLQPFRDSGDLVGEGDFPPGADDLAAMLAAARAFVPNTEIRG